MQPEVHLPQLHRHLSHHEQFLARQLVFPEQLAMHHLLLVGLLQDPTAEVQLLVTR
jgi:hypothetical protein